MGHQKHFVFKCSQTENVNILSYSSGNMFSEGGNPIQLDSTELITVLF